ncbi:C3 and PZP-like alpha-2-macroglobulin domain-containing protein 8 [Mytilus edulis]|uniref:C3 and PZP-like alpha-2-macroglobulin domain-containing protein 8 n=1 Tax=Mytilus edulis TaxID=6550 RepID=UPI0039F08C15
MESLTECITKFEPPFVSGEDIHNSTPNKPTYIILSNLGITLTHGFISFKVKARSDVHFALISGNTEYEQLYEIVIGGWTNKQSVIRTVKQGKPVSLKKGTFLDERKFKAFWISWNDTTINVGHGLEVASGKIFLEWTNPNGLRPILNAGFYTAFGSTG